MTDTGSSPSTGLRSVVRLRRACLSLLACLVAAVPNVVRSQCIDYGGSFRFLGTCDLPDHGRDVAVVGDLAYVVSGVACNGCTGRLDVFDLSTVGQPGGVPSNLAGIELPGGPVSIVVVGESGYVGASGGRIHVVDVSDSLAPTLVTTLPVDEIYDLAADSAHLFAATDSGLHVYDLADPDSPVVIGSCTFAGGAKSVALSGTLAFVVWGGFGSGGSGLSVVDVSEPTNPLVLSTIWSTAVASTVAVSGGRAYLGGGFRYRYMDGFIDVIDVRDPLHPVIEASLEDLRIPVQGIAIVGDAIYATAADPWYFSGDFYVVDARDPGAPILVHEEQLEFQALGPCIANGIVYYCEHRKTGGLRFATAPGDVRPKALSTLPWSVDIYSVDIQADLAYLIDSSPVLKVMDFSDAANPQTLGTMTMSARGEVIEVQGSYAYVGYLIRAMSVVDISNPQLPRIVASVLQAYGVMDIAASGSWLYAIGWNGMWAIDISNPLSPVVRGYLAVDGFAITLDGAHAYVLDGYNFHVIDVTNPAVPALIGTLGTEAGRDLAVSGQHAFVVDWHGVQIIDLADPAVPVEVGRMADVEPLHARRISIQGDHAYLARDRMAVVDIRDPINPVVVGESETQVGSWPRDLVAGEQFVLVAGENLRVFPRQCPPIAREWLPSSSRELDLRVAPNPMLDEARLELNLDRALPAGAPLPVRVLVMDVAGRVVARLADRSLEVGTHVLRWDGRRDCDGRTAPAGVYWLRVDAAGMSPRTARIVKLPGR